MPGIMDIYIAHAENHISKHLQTGTISDISRRQVELDVLQVLDKNNFPIEMKLSWYHAILSTSLFESFWRGTSMRCQIPAANLIRYIPDETQQDFKVPPGMELSIRSSQSSLKKKVAAAIQDCQTGSTAKRKGKRNDEAIRNELRTTIPQAILPNPITYSSSDSETSDTDTPTPSQIALAAKLGRLSQQDSLFDKNAKIPDPNGLARETGDDGEYGSPPKAAGAAAKAKERKPRVRGSAKYVKGSAMDSLKRQRQGFGANKAFIDVGGVSNGNGVSANGRKRTMTAKARGDLASLEM